MEDLDKRFEKIERSFSALTGGVTKDEFEQAFKNAILPFLEKMVQKINSLEETYQALLKRIGEEHSNSLSDLKGQVNDVFVGDQIKRIDSESKMSHAEMKGVMTETMRRKMEEMEYEHQEYKKDIEEMKKEITGTAKIKHAEMDSHLKTLEYGKNFDIDNKLKDFKEETKKDLRELKELLQGVASGKRMGRAKVPIVRFIDLTSSVDGSTVDFALAPDVVAIHGVFSTQFPQIFNTSDWSFAGRTLTTNFTLQSGQSLIVVADVLFYP